MSEKDGSTFEVMCKVCGRWVKRTHNLSGYGATCPPCFNRIVDNEAQLARDEREYADDARAAQYPA